MNVTYTIERYKKNNSIFTATNNVKDLITKENPIDELFDYYDVYRVIINFGFKRIIDFINVDPVYFIQKMHSTDIDIYSIDINDWIYLVNLHPRLNDAIYKDIVLKGNYGKPEIILYTKSVKERVEEAKRIDIISSIWE